MQVKSRVNCLRFMHRTLGPTTISVGFISRLLSCTAIIVNAAFYHYQGNNYLPPQKSILVILLCLMLLGSYLQFGRQHRMFYFFLELIILYHVMLTVSLMSTAAQYCPFPTIDKYIITFESWFNFNITNVVSWTAEHQVFKDWLCIVYSSISLQLACLPILCIALQHWRRIHAYYFLFLLSAIIGFSIYYFFPTTAPASNMNSPFFFANQYATGLKFKQIHDHLPVTIMQGGLVALPSFHVIWALLCVYLVKDIKILFIPILIVNTLMICSCVLLGWHYISDVIGGFVIVFITYMIYKKI